MSKSEDGKTPRPRRAFTAEFKAEIVELCLRGDRSVGRVARDFDLTETAVRQWVGDRPGVGGDQQGSVRRRGTGEAGPRERRVQRDGIIGGPRRHPDPPC
jgi:transposase